MKVIWQASIHQTPREKEYTSNIEAQACVDELLEMGRQFRATWIIIPHIEDPK